MTVSIPRAYTQAIVVEETLTADASDEALNSQLRGYYLTQVELLASLDSTVTFTINTGGYGAEISSFTGDCTTAQFMTMIPC